MSRAGEQAYPVLSIDAPDFAERLMEALGVKPGESVSFVTPQFNRTDGVVPAIPDSWSMLSRLSVATLRAIGCCPWDAPDEHGNVLMLFPSEWYDKIPDGYKITDINGEIESFKRGVTDDDRRYGVLAYGVQVRADATLKAMEESNERG